MEYCSEKVVRIVKNNKNNNNKKILLDYIMICKIIFT